MNLSLSVRVVSNQSISSDQGAQDCLPFTSGTYARGRGSISPLAEGRCWANNG